MAYRRSKSDEYQRARKWNEWIDRCRKELKEIGLAPSVYLDEARWTEFIETGELERYPDGSWFSFQDLGPDEMSRLCGFLEREYGQQEPCPLLLSWLRVRRESNFSSGPTLFGAP